MSGSFLLTKRRRASKPEDRIYCTRISLERPGQLKLMKFSSELSDSEDDDILAPKAKQDSAAERAECELNRPAESEADQSIACVVRLADCSDPCAEM